MSWVGILAFLADRICKQLATEWLKPDMPKVLWNGVLSLTYTQNTGMAFSILADRTWLLIVVSAAALLVLVWALRRVLQDTPLRNVLLWLLLAGGISNLMDRLFSGYVIDFISVQFIRFPVFNVADICLTVSAVILAIVLLRNPDEKGTDEPTAEEGPAA